jgi:glutamate dehydrogenase
MTKKNTGSAKASSVHVAAPAAVLTSPYLTPDSPLMKAILAEVKAGTDEASFLGQFYNHAPTEDWQALPAKTLANIVIDVFKAYKKRIPDAPTVRIYTPSLNVPGLEVNDTIIEIINDDMPFLVDSCTEALNRHELVIRRILHPILRVERNAKGELTTLYSAEEAAKKKGKAESVIHFYVAHLSDPEFIENVKQDIEYTLETVRIAVQDWKETVAKARTVSDELQTKRASIGASLTQMAKAAAESYSDETRAFIDWLCDNNFIFLGYAQYDFSESTQKQFNVTLSNRLGVFKTGDTTKPTALERLPAEVQSFAKDPRLVEITKSNHRSLVHRPVHMDDISIKRFDDKGNVIGEHRFRGLFTSIVYYQSAIHIPLIRQKIEHIQSRAGFAPGGHSSKELAAIVESFPRDELLQITEDELFDICMGIVSLAVQRRIRLFARKDKFERFISCILFVPRPRFSTGLREKIQNVIARAFNGTVVNHYTQVTDSPFARLNLIVKTEPGAIPDYCLADIEAQITEVSRQWADTLRDEIFCHADESKCELLFETYSKAFSPAYCDRFTAYHAYWDIKSIERLYKTGTDILFDLYEIEKEPTLFHLKIYSRSRQLLLSSVMPLLDNMGFPVSDEHTFEVTPHRQDAVWIHHFRLNSPESIQTRPDLKTIKSNFEMLLARVWSKQAENDGLNQLVLCAGLEWEHVILVRAYAKYLRQIGFTYDLAAITRVLAKHPVLAQKLVALFVARFDPALRKTTQKAKAAEERAEALRQEIEEALAAVSDVVDDRVIRQYLALIQATLRTNYYQPDADGNRKNYISFKFRSADIPGLPLPHPYAEIFVYSARVEGIHLRGGKVARGGLRWSDRPDDFRTEVLGLVKAQMTKNAVIVPVGSKGGFVLKQPPKEGGREAFLQEGVACYQTFLSGLLDLTDNIVSDAIVPPSDVVRHDEDDPYLVVAADKGTATFSDYANAISAKYGFWLGDAFASGGSAGYDHKKMGITARGGWVSVDRHFQEMGINIQKTDFTVAGIGDMAGDVFGNGMLLSKHICLVAAFNHLHIFLDPNPNAAASFKERERLFSLPRSSWTDYDAKLISKGGGIFERSAKTIPLSKEVKELLSIQEDSLSPDKLIRAILKAPVDLLWNGGIGTYVKAEDEAHSDVGDKANDALRINGSELRCKVIGEGGNLGFTQKGRIEYALRGGRLNTDFIDNSAGVDCSDHEVNMKIALGQAIEAKKLAAKDRDALLESMTDEVAQLVLRDNELQAQALTIAEQQGVSQIEQQQRLMRRLERDGLLYRGIEFLPSDEAISRRAAEKKGLTRPELAVLLSYSKQAVYKDLLESNLTHSDYFDEDLQLYFPEAMRDRFGKLLPHHLLKKEIITTCVTNSIVNRCGITFFHSVLEDTGMKGCDIARAYVIIREVFGLRDIWTAIEALDESISVETRVSLFLEIQKLIERNTHWFLRNHPHPLPITDLITTYASGVKILFSCLEEILSPLAMRIYRSRLTRYKEAGVPDDLARTIAGIAILTSGCDIVKVAQNGKLPVNIVGKIYFELGGRLSLGTLRTHILEQPANGYWEGLSLRMLLEDLFNQQMRLTAAVIKHNCNDTLCLTSVANWCEANKKEIGRYDQFINDFKAAEHIDTSMLIVAVKQVEMICSVE